MFKASIIDSVLMVNFGHFLHACGVSNVDFEHVSVFWVVGRVATTNNI